MNIRFIHCSDIHLGKTLKNNQERYFDYFSAFQRVADASIERNVDFLVIAGDLFHRGNIAPSTLAHSVEIFQQLKDAHIPVVAIEGNHDFFHQTKNESWLHFLSRMGYMRLLRPGRDPDSREIYFDEFNPDTGVGGWTEIKGCKIYGIGYYASQTMGMLEKSIAALPERADIGIFHCGVWESEMIDIGRVTKSQILSLSGIFRYVALGHAHKYYRISDGNKREFAFNPGTLELVNENETEYEDSGRGKFFLVEMDSESIKADTETIPRRPYINTEIDISGAGCLEEVMNRIKEHFSTDPYREIKNNKPVIRLILKGRIDFPPLEIDSTTIEQYLDSLFSPVLSSISIDASQYVDMGLVSDWKNHRDRIFREAVERLVKGNTKYDKKTDDILSIIVDLKSYFEDNHEESNSLETLADIIHEKRIGMNEQK